MSESPQVAGPLLSVSWGRTASESACHLPCSECGSEKVLDNCWMVRAGRGPHLLPPCLQALRQGCVAAGLLAGLRDHHEEGWRPAPLGQGRTCQSEPHQGCQLGSCCVNQGFTGRCPSSLFLCPRLGCWAKGAEQVPGGRNCPRPSFPLHARSHSPVMVLPSVSREARPLSLYLILIEIL